MHRMMQIHVTAPYLINLGLVPLLNVASAAQADIIHVGDYLSDRGSTKHIAYPASKATQDNLPLSFAARLASQYITGRIQHLDGGRHLKH